MKRQIFTIICFMSVMLWFTLAFYLNLPIAYIPERISTLGYSLYDTFFILCEIGIVSFLYLIFINRFMPLGIELDL